MASRTTHPLALRRLGALLEFIDGVPIEVDNPYVWQTKTQVLERLTGHGGADLITATASCSSVFDRPLELPHCGCCSQCHDRRFAMLAAGLADFDPEARYETELLTGPREGAGPDHGARLDATRRCAGRH